MKKNTFNYFRLSNLSISNGIFAISIKKTPIVMPNVNLDSITN